MQVRHNIIANYLGQAWGALMGLAFVPFYIRYLGVEAYGLIGIFLLLQTLLSLLDLGLAPALSRLQPSGRSTRVYSELASALWQSGETAAAIRVEDFWNALAGTYPFSLYCGYTMDTHSEHSYAAPLEELGRTHSDILGTPEDEEFGVALDRASKEIFGISLTQMAGVSKQEETRRFPSGQRTMLWVKRNLPLSTSQLAERARHYFRDSHAA